MTNLNQRFKTHLHICMEKIKLVQKIYELSYHPNDFSSNDKRLKCAEMISLSSRQNDCYCIIEYTRLVYRYEKLKLTYIMFGL